MRNEWFSALHKRLISSAGGCASWRSYYVYWKQALLNLVLTSESVGALAIESCRNCVSIEQFLGRKDVSGRQSDAFCGQHWVCLCASYRVITLLVRYMCFCYGLLSGFCARWFDLNYWAILVRGGFPYPSPLYSGVPLGILVVVERIEFSRVIVPSDLRAHAEYV